MSTLTGFIVFRGQRLPARIINGHLCVSTAGVALAVGRHPGRLRRIKADVKALIVPAVDCIPLGGETWWSGSGIELLRQAMKGAAAEAARELTDLLVNQPTLLPDPEPSDAALAGHMMAHSGVSPEPESPAPEASA